MPEPEFIFVYGTLRRGQEDVPLSVRLREEAEHIGEGKLQAKLFEIDWYPGAVDSTDPSDQVVGDIFRIDENTELLAALDAFEGCGPTDPEPHEYVREARMIETEQGPISAWTYIYNWDVSRKKLISSGDFLKRR